MTLVVEIRSALATDISQIAQVHLDASKVAYRAILNPLLLDGLSLAGRRALWERRFAGIGASGRLWVQCVGPEVIGFALCDETFIEGASLSACELQSFYLTPECWGKGLGARLIDYVAKDFNDRGYRVMILWTILQNARARSFYEQIGFSCDQETRVTKRRESGLLLEYEEIRYSGSLLSLLSRSCRS